MTGGDKVLPDAIADLFRNQAARREASARRGEPTLELRFVDSTSPSSHALETEFVTQALSRLQRLLNRLVWAEEAGPTVAGNVPAAIQRVANTDLIAITPGSFQITIRKSELELSSTFDTAIGRIFEFIGSSDSPDQDVDLAELVVEIGPVATNRARLFFETLAERSIDLDLGWDEFRFSGYLPADRAAYLSTWLKAADETATTITITGSLAMGDTQGRFRLVDSTGNQFEGSSDVDLSGYELDRSYRAEIRETLLVNSRSGLTRTTHRLLGLETVDSR